jgi:hypothetical protein
LKAKEQHFQVTCLSNIYNLIKTGKLYSKKKISIILAWVQIPLLSPDVSLVSERPLHTSYVDGKTNRDGIYYFVVCMNIFILNSNLTKEKNKQNENRIVVVVKIG